MLAENKHSDKAEVNFDIFVVKALDFVFVSDETLGLNLHVESYVKPCLGCHVLMCCRHIGLLHLSPMAISTSHEGLTCNFLPTKPLSFVYGLLHEVE